MNTNWSRPSQHAAVLILACAITAVATAFLWPRSGLDINCSSAVLYPHLPGNHALDGGVVLMLNEDHSGSISFSGELSLQDDSSKPLNLLRIVYFNYTVENHGFLTLSHFEVRKNISDNVSDALFNYTIFDFSAATRRVQVSQIFPNAWLVGNAFSPVFTCVHK